MSKVEEEVAIILKLLKSLEKDSDRAAPPGPGPGASSSRPCSPDLDDLLRLLLLLLLFTGNGNGLLPSSCSHADSSGRSPWRWCSSSSSSIVGVIAAPSSLLLSC